MVAVGAGAMTRDELLELIEQAAAEGWTELDLAGQNLTELPPEIGQLTQLETLILGKYDSDTNKYIGNQITALPPEIIALEKLHSINLSDNCLTVFPRKILEMTQMRALHLNKNQITKIPSEIVQLSQITELGLQNNSLTKFPETVTKLTELRLLGLGGNEIQEIPESIANLIHLEKILIWANQIKVIPEALAKLTNLQKIHFGKNQIKVIPEALARLTNLQEAYLNENQISTIPVALSNLAQLQKLDLSSNQIEAIPEALERLTQLQELDLGSNQIKTIPEALKRLTKLQKLRLERNQISVIPKILSNLKNLEGLWLFGNKISDFPDDLSKLSSLKQLDLSKNRLSNISDALTKLTRLERLDLWSNKILIIPDTISRLVNLQYLDLFHNQISVIPDAIAQLSNLQCLDLSFNQISDIPDAIAQLSNLQHLDFSFNQAYTIPETLAKLSKLEKLDLRGNPVPVPPELLGPKDKQRDPGNIQTILEYYFQTLDPTETAPLYEAKFIIVGEGGAGKTTLAKKLLNADYDLDGDEKSTEGIDVLRWEFLHSNGSQFRTNIWDFGGQEIYHATHQFFLTKRSLYALVVDTRQENTDLDHWLNIVSLLSDNSPVFLIKNEKQDRQCQVSEKDLQREFPNVEAVYTTNLADNRGLADIAAAIQQRIVRLPHVGIPLPKLWVRVRAALENYADSRNTLTLGEYHELCRTNQLTDPARIATLSRYLHDLGVILHFHDDPILKHTVILKPDWGTDAVYKALDTPAVRANCGRFTRAQLDTIWTESDTAALRDELLQLMMRFKLCYEIPGRPQHYIAPQLLEPNAPDYPWETSHNLILRYRYDFMPKGILTRLIVELHEFIEAQTLVWKTGVVLTNGSARAEVTELYSKRELRLRVSGGDPKRWLSAVTHEIDKIHASYQSSDNPRDTRLRYQTLIPCNCDTCKGSQTPHDYPYDRLQKFLRDGQYQIQCQESYTMVDVRRLLDDVLYRTREPDAKGMGAMASDLLPLGQPVSDTNPVLATAPKQYWSEDNLLDKVFLSYGWGDDNQPVIETIEQICAAQDIPLVRDTKYLKFQDSAQRFMQTLGQSKAIILVIGDAYLKSENCMFELVEIATHGDFHQRVFPIILPSAQTLYDAVERLDYIEHWEQKFTALDQKMKRVRAAKLGNIQETANLYDRIRQNFDQLIGVITDMITVDLKTLDSLDSNPQFTQLLQRLQARLTR
jgi:internalin A